MYSPLLVLLHLSLFFFQASPEDHEQALRRALEQHPRDAVLLSELGATLDAKGKCPEADSVYQAALERGEPSAVLLNNVGTHYVACGQPAKAVPYFERLLKINPAHPNANLQLARIATDEGQASCALVLLERVKDSGPAVALLRAEALYGAGRKTLALAAFDRIAAQAGGDPRILFSLGLTLARLSLYEPAEKTFQAVLAREPADFDVLFNLGHAASRAGHFARAGQVLDVALKLQPEDIDALLEMARVRMALEDYDRAILFLVRARKLDPKRPEVLLTLARASAEARYYGDAVQAYEEYLAVRPEDDEIRRDYAVTYGRMERDAPDVGLRELTAYVKKHPADPVGHYDLALVYAFNDLDKALEELNEALRLDPNLAVALNARGLVLRRIGRFTEAVTDLEAALRINPRDARSLDQLGKAYLALEKPADAERVLRKAVEIAPDNSASLLHLGRALMDQGREQDAATFLRRFRELRAKEQPRSGGGPWLIEAAGLAPEEARRRVIERLRQRCQGRPTDAEPRLQLGNALLADGRVEEAQAAFRELLPLNADAEVLHKAGAALLRYDQDALARDLLTRAAAERPVARLDLAIAVFSVAGPRQALEALGAPLENDGAGDYYLLKAKILDAAGDHAGAEQTLRAGVDRAVVRPRVARDAALLLARLDRRSEAVALLDRSIAASPDDAELRLTRASVLGAMGEYASAENAFKDIEDRWPEWDRPYLAHGLLLETTRPAESKRKLQTALALGMTDPFVRCALGRLDRTAAPDPQCACRKNLQELLFPACAAVDTPRGHR